MPEFVVERIGTMLNDEGKPKRNSTLYLLDVAYKKDIDDYRESSVVTIMEILKKKEANIVYSNPNIPAFRYNGIDMKEFRSLKKISKMPIL